MQNYTVLDCPKTILLTSDLRFYLPFMILISLIVIFNMFVIITFARFSILRQSNNNLLVLSLSVADFTVGLTGICGGVTLLTTGIMELTIQQSNWILIALCTGIFLSCLTLILMTLDRLLAVKKPLRYNQIMSKRSLLILLSVTWVVPLLLCIINIVIMYAMPESANTFSYACMIVFIWIGATVLCSSNILLFRISARAASQVKPNINGHVSYNISPTTVRKSRTTQ